MKNKRRLKRTVRGSYRRVKPNYLPVIFMLCLSVGCGYATAKYVVDPVVNYVPQTAEKKTELEDRKEDKEAPADKESEVLEDRVEVETKGKLSGYALQFGSYSEEAAAEKVMSSLGVKDLKVIEQDGMFKIIGKIYKSKDEARAGIEKLPESVKAFVTEVYE